MVIFVIIKLYHVNLNNHNNVRSKCCTPSKKPFFLFVAFIKSSIIIQLEYL